MADKKHPISESRVSHIHDLMSHTQYAIKETIRCLKHSTLAEMSEIDEAIIAERVEVLKTVLPAVEDIVGIFAPMEKSLLKRDRDEVSAWDIAERVERIGDRFFPPYFEKFSNLHSHELDDEKLKVRLKELRKKSLKVLNESRELSSEYSMLSTEIKDGEYFTDEINAKIQKEIEADEKKLSEMVKVKVYIDGKEDFLVVETEEVAKKYREKHFTFKNRELVELKE